MFASRISHFARTSRLLAIMLTLLATLTLVGCGGESGTYVGKNGGETMTLKLDGGKYTMTVTSAGSPPKTTNGNYKVDGKNITVEGPSGIPIPFVLDGKKLSGPFGMELIKQ